jgi:thiamine-monophosphate kinase
MELDFLRWLKPRLPPRPWLGVGPGDDAAVLQLGKTGNQVVTCDLLADGVHFRADRDEPRRIGRKALAVNLSDLAAMAARPLAAFISVALPDQCARELAEQLYDGIIPLAEQYDVAIAGGDTNSWDGPLVISITLLGTTDERQPMLRNGAKLGDRLIVTGSFGGSSLGRHFDFEPRVAEALLLAKQYELHAGMDCSDGLALDVSQLAEASGCGAVIDVSHVPISDAAHRLAAELTEQPALSHALGDGEDFELILAVPPNETERLLSDQPLETSLCDIGSFTEQPGLWQRDGDRRIPLEPTGYEHGPRK